MFTEKQEAQEEKLQMFEKKREEIRRKNQKRSIAKQEIIKNVQVIIIVFCIK